MSRPAPSVALGLQEANRRWPNRRTASDGMLGDPLHAGRPSDHNPDGRGIVHAFDLTNDPGRGVDCNRLAEAIRLRRDSRVKYVIWNRRIFHGPHSDEVRAGWRQPWAWATYNGENPHSLHMHVSVGHATAAENNLSPWYGKEETDMDVAELRREFVTPGGPVRLAVHELARKAITDALETKGSPERAALRELAVRAVNSALGVAPGNDTDQTGRGSPAREGLADLLGQEPEPSAAAIAQDLAANSLFINALASAIVSKLPPSEPPG